MRIYLFRLMLKKFWCKFEYSKTRRRNRKGYCGCSQNYFLLLRTWKTASCKRSSGCACFEFDFANHFWNMINPFSCSLQKDIWEARKGSRMFLCWEKLSRRKRVVVNPLLCHCGTRFCNAVSAFFHLLVFGFGLLLYAF